MSVRSVRTVEVAADAGKIASATSTASTLSELISTIPRAYQALLGDQLTKKYRIAQKHANVQSTIALYDRHSTEGSFPPIIRNSLKEPKLQFAKEFLATTSGSNAPSEFQASVITARTNVLKSAIKQKNVELEHLASLILPDESAWQSSVRNVGESVAKSVGGSRVQDNAGKWSLSGVTSTAATEFASMHGACQVYTYRVLALARAAIDRAELQKLAKIQIKDATDVEMTDVSKEPAVRDIIREELKAFKVELSKPKGTSSPAKRRGEVLTSPRKAKQNHRPSYEETQWGSEETRKERWEQEGGKEEGKEVSIDAYLAQCSKSFRPWAPETFPNVYLSLNEECRLKLGIAFLREWEADSLRAAKPGVFQATGVQLPEDIAYSLAVNHKFILHPKPQDHDVAQAKERFVRSVRVRWQFRNEPSKPEGFVPKFHVGNPFWQPQKASKAIELGLDKAMAALDSQVGQALATMAISAPSHGNMNWTRVQKFLEDNNLLVKLTDKNLGLAVFTKEWYLSETIKMLSDQQTYRKVPALNVEKLLDTLLNQLSKWKLPPGMEKFVRVKTTSRMPVFHTIPKVHKTPWTLRPIVPSHSWVTSRLSEVVDHLCRPLLEKMPWVVDSTKKVINNLTKVRIESGSDVWICTGDVAAFYTNVDAKNCAKTVAGAWSYYQPDSKISGKAIAEMIRFVMDNNYFSFQDNTYQQQGGLAMGTASAPVLANIYAARYERRLGVMNHSGVLLYNRYIDDILCIFQGTREELVAFLPTIELGPLTINWSFSATKKEFLDVEIMRIRDVTGTRLATRLFQKAMNRHLYIPWSSAHPSHVKKAFVKAELIRFTIISSEVGYFADARSQFYGNLRRRGYPPQTLENWFQQVSYDNRPLYLSSVKDKPEVAPLMLSGQYNPVWDCINVDEILRSARREWNLEKNLPETLQQPLIRSLRRHTSLFDLMSTWNKTVLHPTMLSSENSVDSASSGEPGLGSLPEGSDRRWKALPGRRSLELVDRRGRSVGFGT